MANQKKRKTIKTTKRKIQSRRKVSWFQSLSLIQKLIMLIIIVLFLIVILFLLFRIFHTTQNLVETKVNSLASDYYENYLYPNYTKNNKQSPTEILEKYNTTGLSVVYLRQFLYHDNKVDKDTIDYLVTHCDQNKTYVKYYPEPPYEKTSYRADISYSCDF